MGGLAQSTTAEPHGTPKNNIRGNYAPKSNFFRRSPFQSSRFPITSSLGPISNISAVSKRRVLLGGWSIGSRRKASGHNGPLRNLAAPHGTMDNGKPDKMGRRGNWRNPTEPGGTPRNTKRVVLTPQIHLFFSCFWSTS